MHSKSTAATSLDSVDWPSIHTDIEAEFKPLETRLRRERPDLTTRSERVRTERFQLNYLAFDPPPNSPGLESLVVGIRFDLSADELRLSGDICTEESGRILYEDRRDCPVSPSEAAAAARETARRLAAHWKTLSDYFGSRPADSDLR